jgi:hypothetical protein
MNPLSEMVPLPSLHPLISSMYSRDRRFCAHLPNIMFHRRNLEIDLLKCQHECGIGACPESYQATSVSDRSGVFQPQFAESGAFREVRASPVDRRITVSLIVIQRGDAT